MIIYGSRMYGKRDVVKGWGICDNCGNFARNISYNARKWGHIYFIPLIPAGPKVRVIMECKKCDHGLHLPEKELPEIKSDIRKSTDKALAALITGAGEFTDKDGSSIPCVESIVGSINLLHALGSSDYVELVTAALQEKELHYAYHLVYGESQEFSGKLKLAEASYRKAAELEPTETFPILALGAVYLSNDDPEKARLIYEQALAMTDQKVPILDVLLNVYTVLKEFDKVAETYEALFEHLPELKTDKKTVKAYKKACKKAKREPAL